MADEMVNVLSSESEDMQKNLAFEEHIRKLFITCENIRNALQTRKVITKNNRIYDGFAQFVATYDNKAIGPENTMIIFEDFYTKNRFKILSRKDTWIAEGASIEYPSKKSKRKPVLCLSAYYRNAKMLAAEAEKEITDYGRDEEAENVFLPEELTYSLLELFSLVAPSTDMEKLNQYKEEIKAELPSTNITPNNPLGGLGGMAGMGGLGGMLGNLLSGDGVQKLFGEMGASMGGAGGQPNLAMPEGVDPVDAITGLFQSPNVRGIVTKVTDKLKTGNPAGIGATIGDILADKELQENIQSSLKGLIPEPVMDRESQQLIAEAKAAHPDPAGPSSSSSCTVDDLFAPMASASGTTIVSNDIPAQRTVTSVIQLDIPVLTPEPVSFVEVPMANPN